MKLTNSISISGTTGTGKSYGVCKLVNDLGLKAVVLDFEKKTEKTVKLLFPEAADRFEIVNVMLRKEEPKTDITKVGKITSRDMRIVLKNAPDYLKSFLNLKDNLINNILERSDFDVLVYDGATPILRNQMGLEYWRMLHPDRDNPMPEEWGAMNDIERAFIEGGIGWAEENNGLFIVTGQMKDLYRGDKVIGEVPAISTKVQHTIDVTLQVEKKIGLKTEYVCTCLDSIKGQWIENLTFDRHIIDVLIEKELIGYD
jgi:hypothetical protein